MEQRCKRLQERVKQLEIETKYLKTKNKVQKDLYRIDITEACLSDSNLYAWYERTRKLKKEYFINNPDKRPYIEPIDVPEYCLDILLYYKSDQDLFLNFLDVYLDTFISKGDKGIDIIDMWYKVTCYYDPQIGSNEIDGFEDHDPDTIKSIIEIFEKNLKKIGIHRCTPMDKVKLVQNKIDAK